MTKTIRAAAAQFHVGNDVEKNLETCVRMIREAATHRPHLLVLPEFSNHCSWYDDAAHCYAVSVDLDGEFLQTIAQAVRDAGALTVINCTVRRDNEQVTGTSIMFAPSGAILGTTDKQVLIGHENDFLRRSQEAGPIVDTELGRLAMYSCMDGVINETPRCLALRGAQVLCNSLNSFAIDEGTLHIPVRAAENRVWVVAANKVGPLIPEALVGPVSEATSIPAHFLDGAGDSQIVAPDGTVVAMAGKQEEVVVARIDVSAADDKRRADGTDIFRARRPALYAAIGEDPASQPAPTISGPVDVVAASVSLEASGEEALEEAAGAVGEAVEQDARLICLPALVGTTGLDDATAGESAIARIAGQLGDGAIAATAVAVADGDGRRFDAVLIDATGCILQQPLLHASERYAWSATSDEIGTVETPHGRLAVLHGDDAIYPETFRLLALAGVSTVLVPGDFLEAWETDTGLIERSAENRINVVAASHRGSADRGLICSLQKDFTIMTEWQERPFDGLLSAPEVERNTSGRVFATVHPLAARNKECSQNTDVVASRPWWLAEPIIRT